MAEFKSSNLIAKLEKEHALSEGAWNFVIDCMDDWFVDETDTSDGMMYDLRSMLHGIYKGENVSVAQIYYGDFKAIAILIEHLAMVQTHCFGGNYT